MKAFDAEFTIYGSYETEDPHCPSFWQGSGVYQISVPVEQKATAIVFADSEEEAIAKLKEYDYTDQPDYILEECRGIDIHSIVETDCDRYDEDDDEDVTVFYSEPRNTAWHYMPDPDDRL